VIHELELETERLAVLGVRKELHCTPTSQLVIELSSVGTFGKGVLAHALGTV